VQAVKVRVLSWAPNRRLQTFRPPQKPAQKAGFCFFRPADIRPLPLTAAQFVGPKVGPGNDLNQRVYVLSCGECGHAYGANGSYIWLRRCPACQSGALGLIVEVPVNQHRRLIHLVSNNDPGAPAVCWMASRAYRHLGSISLRSRLGVEWRCQALAVKAEYGQDEVSGHTIAASKFPLRHISLRVPWHDAAWNATVCADPRHNTACLKLLNMAQTQQTCMPMAANAERPSVDIMPW
jgi:hypothetical protein